MFKEHPELEVELIARLSKRLEGSGIEPEPELVLNLALEAVASIAADHLALVREVLTEEDTDRILREEADRLMDPETKLIKDSDLDEAAAQRIKQELKSFFPQRFGGL